MMRRRVVIPALLLAATAAMPAAVHAQYGGIKLPEADASTMRFTAQQIDNLAGPVALYPDALLAQVLVAATFPDQVEDAAAFVKSYGTDSVDTQPWDVSVKAVAHYPSALNTLADKIDWTTALGKAYAMQSSDVMASVQRLRKMAADQGNLTSTPQQNVVAQNNTYQIVPVEPRVMYVPVYDPYMIYSRPIFTTGFSSRWFSFGTGYPIGAWLIYDCDWGLRRVYYNGWSPSYYAFGGGWRQRSRPFIQVTNIYVNTRYTNVYVNRNVNTRVINYYNVDRYASVHGGRHFEGRGDGRYDRDDRSRYANRTDTDGRAVPGEGYTNPNNGGTRNTGGNTNNRPGSTRDGSGYGNDRTDSPDGGSRSARPKAPDVRRNEPVVQENIPQVIYPERRQPANLGGGDVIVAPRRAEPRVDDSPRNIDANAGAPERRQKRPGVQIPDAPRQPEPRQAEPRQAQPRQEAPREQPRAEPRNNPPSVIRAEPRAQGNDSKPASRSARPKGGN